jgi:ribosomal protein S18 acetylase RimI-like enzyme
MAERVRTRLGLASAPPLEIVDYRPAYKKHFRALNEQWLLEHFRIEEVDRRLLDDPNRNIIKRGGSILFALRGGAVVGTCALLRHKRSRKNGSGHGVERPAARIHELSKMAVAESARRQGIGTLLTREVITRAAADGAAYLYLQTSPRLKIAGRLYRKLGFRRVRRHPLPGDSYRRPTITMRLDLSRYHERPVAKERS